MSLRTRVLPALLNGISQQPPLLRSPDQMEAELNTWGIVAEGVGKRPPTEFLADLGVTITSDTYVHHINRDVTERYLVLVSPTGIRVFDHITGAEKTVNAPEGYGYLTGGAFKAVTVADYTFIVNTNKACTMATVGTDAIADPTYYRWLNSRAINAVGGIDVGFAFDYSVGGAPLQYEAAAGDGSYMGELPSMEKLPETAANGTMYKITGSVESGFVSYYVRRNGAVWDETVANGLKNALSPQTMPHALVREGDGTFTFAPFSWQSRRVGDEDTNPPPTFIGRNIRDVFFYQNRLGFLVDENVVFSCAGDFGNFWRNTVLDYVKSDVIDVAVTTSSVTLLNHALPFNDGILAFSDQVQFSISNGEDGLTPESAAIQPVTRYEVNTAVRPVTIGTEVYFCGDQNGSSIVWEYTRQEEADGLAAAEITAHVPSLVPSGVRKLIAAQNHKALFALTGTSKVYVYQFYWNGNEKIQSAWREWDFGDPVLGGEYIDGNVYLLISRADGVMLERLNLEAGAKPAEQPHQVYLDQRTVVTGVYDPINDKTTFTFPFEVTLGDIELIRPSTHPTRPGSLIDPSTYTRPSPTVIEVPFNEVGIATAGRPYTMRLQFSQQFPQDFQGRPLTTGRLQLRTFTVYYSKTAFFRTEVSPYGQALNPDVEAVVPAKIADFTGKVVGDSDLRLNQPSYHTGSYSFQIYGDANQATIALSNDTHVGSTFVSAEWEGFYFNRALG